MNKPTSLETMHLFERPCLAGWVYPCTVDDIADRLIQVPEADLEGLWAVGLAPSTRKDNTANGRYFYRERPFIHIYSYRSNLRFRLLAKTKHAETHPDFQIERRFGMTIEREGSRYVCVWTPENLRDFIVEHVLLHEIGHHVYHRRRKHQGFASCPNVVEAEQFAEAYAIRRHSRARKAILN